MTVTTPSALGDLAAFGAVIRFGTEGGLRVAAIDPQDAMSAWW